MVNIYEKINKNGKTLSNKVKLDTSYIQVVPLDYQADFVDLYYLVVDSNGGKITECLLTVYF